MNEHRGLSHLAAAQATMFDVGPGSRVLQFASASFDASVWEVVMALGHGASLHLAARSDLMPGRPLLETLSRHGITHVTLPPSALAVCDDAEVAFAAGTVIVAAARRSAPAGRRSRWSSRVALYNAYGPTETTVCATVHRCAPGSEVVPIGRPMPNTRMYILDAQREPVPIGVCGELYIGGVGVARGYLNRPELTSERFLRDPFSGDPTARMYKTGDVARWLADGTVECLGRNDFQVKIRGFRIELGEIEARLSTLEGVSEVVVLAREDEPGERRLVAYFTGATAPAAEVVRTHAREGLAEYMVPAAYVHLDALPRTPNGKVDRQALPAPDGGAHVSRGYEAPQGEVEQTLAAIWAGVLKLDRVGRHDDFFELGGHSLLAVQLVSRLRARDRTWTCRARRAVRPSGAARAGARALGARSDAQPILAVAAAPLAAVARAAASLVPVAVRGGQPRVPHRRLRLKRGARPSALCRALDRASWSATRRCARGSCRWTVSRRRWSTRATAACRSRRARSARRGSRSAELAALVEAGVGGALRSRARAADPRAMARAGRPGPRAPRHDASHRVGRLVDGRAGQRAERALRGLQRREAGSAAVASGSVRRLRGVAAPGGSRASGCSGRRRTGSGALAGAPVRLDVPGDRPRPSEQSYAGAHASRWRSTPS